MDPRSEILDQQDSVITLIPRQEWFLDPTRARAYPLGGATAAGGARGRHIPDPSSPSRLPARFLQKCSLKIVYLREIEDGNGAEHFEN